MKCIFFTLAAAAVGLASAGGYFYEDRGADHIPGTVPGRTKGSVDEASTARAYRQMQAIDVHGRMLPPVGVNLVGFIRSTSITWNPAGTNIYVAEKTGLVKLFHQWTGSGAGRANVVLDLTDRVTSWGDHGLTTILYSETGGLPYLYVTYMKLDPLYGNVCEDHGQVDGRPMDAIEGCAIYGRFSRFPIGATGRIDAADEEVILDTETATLTDMDGNVVANGCSQFSTHSVPVAVVELDGYFYTSLGDGAAFTLVDGGQLGTNPCNDNPGYLGAFRSQDPRRLNGKILRWHPAATAAAWQFEVWSTGHRNPFRLSSDEALGVVLQTETGWYSAEEINVISKEPAFKGTNFGWPCFEGPVHSPEYTNFFGQNPYCLTIAQNSTYFYTHPPENADGVKPPTSVSAVALGPDGRMYYADLSQMWIRSVPFSLDTFPVDLADATYRTEANNVYASEIKNSPMGMIFVDHFPGIIRSMPGAVGEAVPSVVPLPKPYCTLHRSNGAEWIAGQTITVGKASNLEGREGAEWRWNATLLTCLEATPDTCMASLVAEDTTGGDFEFTAPAYPGTIEVFTRGRTYGGATINGTAYFVASAAAVVCTCRENRTMLSAVPSFTPTPAPSQRISASRSNGRVDTNSIAFKAGVGAAGAAVGVALIAAGIIAGARAKAAKAPLTSNPRLATSAAHGGSSNDARPLTANPGLKTASTESDRAERVKKAGFAPQQTGGAAPNFLSPTAGSKTGQRAV